MINKITNNKDENNKDENNKKMKINTNKHSHKIKNLNIVNERFEIFFKKSIDMHRKYNGNLDIISKNEINNSNDLSTAYSPGIAGPCLIIKKNKDEFKTLTSAGKTIAVISDGSAVLGLGNIGPKAAMPVMEGKSVLFKKFGDLNAIPIILNTQNTEEIIETIKNIAPSFAGINLEDISAPRCFEIEERLEKELDIPVFHDDQHGTAIVVLAGIINSLKLVKKRKENIKVVLSGSGAAGVAIVKLLHLYGIQNFIICDSKGIISKSRTNLNSSKLELLKFSNKENISGNISDALKNTDVFIGVSKCCILNEDHIKSMNKDPIIFAMANPYPEIMPELAKKGGAKIVATGRSDYHNQLNNVLVFPGIFKGAIKVNAKNITNKMKISAAIGLAGLVKNITYEKIIPSPFDKGVSDAVAKAVIEAKLAETL